MDNISIHKFSISNACLKAKMNIKQFYVIKHGSEWA